MQIIAISIKTIPDIETGRRLYKIKNLSDDGVAKAMFHLHQQKAGSETLPHYLQKIVAIAVCVENEGVVQTTLLGDEKITEKALLELYATATKGRQQVTWNGNNSDFPILQYRALKWGVALEGSSNHLDLSRKLSYGGDNECPSLYEVSCFLDLPELQQDSADAIWKLWQSDDTSAIYASAKRDLSNVYQIFSLF